MKHQKGFSLVEMMMATSVLAVVMAGSMTLQSRVMVQTTSNNDRAFASEKATQMFEELRSFVQSNRETDISKLQNFSDGSGYNTVLTTEKKVVDIATGEEARDLDNAADTLSGNTRLSGHWKYVRQIQVNPVPNDPNARYVSVKVWKADASLNPKGQPLASIAGVLKTNITSDPPTQVYDLYLIAMENAPSWWVDLANLRPAFERTLLDLEQRNPGLTFRRHFINRFGFGRDPYYLPHINNQGNADTQSLPWVYLYPGQVNHSDISENYVVGNMDGRVRTDESLLFFPLDKTHSNYNTLDYREYALADQFNHVLRFPEQFAMEQRLIDEDPDTYRDNISLSMMLHRLNEGSLRNAIIVNLHGELLPLPPVRNYSDPAKDPSGFSKLLDAANPDADFTISDSDNEHPAFGQKNENYTSLAYKRVVTHPENLRYDNDDTVSWRVYPYEEIQPGLNSPTSLPNNVTDKSEHSIPAISLFIPTIDRGPGFNGGVNGGYLSYPDLDLTTANLSDVIDAIQVEKVVGSDNQPYAWWNQTALNPLLQPATQITHTHDPADADAVFIAGNALQSTPLAAPVAGDTTVTVPGVLNRDDLVNSLIVLSAGTNNEEVVRVQEVAGAVITLTRPLERDHNTAPLIPITRHKDFDVEIINENMFQHSQRGIRITLYDTPTRHPQNAIPGNQDTGLRNDRRLDGLEYIPSSIGTSGGVATFGDGLATTDTDDYKNTARWRVSLDTSASVFGGAFNYIGSGTNTSEVPVFPIETRMLTSEHMRGAPSLDPATGKDYRSALTPAITNCSSNLAELCEGIWGDGDTYVPDDPSTTTVDEHQNQLRTNLHNVSRTYIYMNHEFTDKSADDFPSNRIPKLEQAQFMGHHLMNPYLDVKNLHRYNRHYSSERSGRGLAGFDRANGLAWDRTEVDMNWFFNLYNNGIMRSNAIYNSISGFSNYYYSFGGELGTDGTNAVFRINNQPWTETDNSGLSTNRNRDSIINEITVDSRVITTTQNSLSGGNVRWRGRLHTGELFPDQEHDFWVANGNLPTYDYDNATHHAGLLFPGGTATPANEYVYFRRQSRGNGDSHTGNNAHRRLQRTGAPSFANGSGDPIGNRDAGLEHKGSNGTARLTSGAGQFVVNSFNLNLNDTLDANRPYFLTGNSGSGGYKTKEMRDIRNRLSFINNQTGATSNTPTDDNIYYRHSNNNSWASSAIVKMSRPKPGSPTEDIEGLKGYVLMNGLKNASGTGVQEMARFTQAGSLQTYMDAGDRNIPGQEPGRSVQLPRVQILNPRASQIQVSPTVINVEYQVDWFRWDGKPYSPAYPSGWYDSVPLMYNFKYSSDNKRTWKYAHDNSDVEPRFEQAFNPAALQSAAASSTSDVETGTFAWNVASLPEGNHVFRIEAYREGYTEVGYSYHDVFITIER